MARLNSSAPAGYHSDKIPEEKSLSLNPFASKRKLAIFLGYYKPHMRLFLLDMGCAFIISLVDLSFPLLSRYSLNTLIPQKAWGLFAILVGAVAAAFVLRGFLHYIVTYWGHLLGVRMETDIRKDLFVHLQKLPFSFYDKTRTGHLMSRVVSDLFEIVELAHHGPEDLFISAITLTGSFIAMAFIWWPLAAVLAVFVPVIVIFTARRRKVLAKAALDVKQKTAGINANLESSISGVRETKAFAIEDYEVE
ncbi:MAG: ABC transporter ATP-binding protein [Spirochaetia bacterium]|nr:ABC transporter ATP-binding protein [Spirochaetia bacterium]